MRQRKFTLIHGHMCLLAIAALVSTPVKADETAAPHGAPGASEPNSAGSTELVRVLSKIAETAKANNGPEGWWGKLKDDGIPILTLVSTVMTILTYLVYRKQAKVMKLQHEAMLRQADTMAAQQKQMREQSEFTARSLSLEATVTRLASVKLRLETCLRGACIPLAQQSLLPRRGEDKGRVVEYLTDQICASDATDREAVKELVETWLNLEDELDRLCKSAPNPTATFANTSEQSGNRHW